MLIELTHLKAQGKQVKNPVTGLIAEDGKVADFGLVWCQAWWHWLLCFASFEVSEIHGSVFHYNGVSSI